MGKIRYFWAVPLLACACLLAAGEAPTKMEAAPETVGTETVVTQLQPAYAIYEHPVYGRYVDAREFGSDPSGQHDSLPAIQAAMAVAHQEQAALYLAGQLYISDQLVINEHNDGIRGLFGDGKTSSTVFFDRPQTGVFNPNTNLTDVRREAGVLIDGVSGKFIAQLAVVYRNPDFYRVGEPYFGKVNGIMVNDASDMLIDGVGVRGANRAGIFFTSTKAHERDPRGTGHSYRDRLIRNEITERDEALPLGRNNRVRNSDLSHNRVAGLLLGYQAQFVAEHNYLARNGHEADGGTGYGAATMAGSYNFGVTFQHNETDHNYRKGLDSHDGNNIVITNNRLVGDRLYGIAVYNRQFTMNDVTITNNTIVADPAFRLEQNDNPRYQYHGYSGIQVQTNTQRRDLHSADTGTFVIEHNTIEQLDLYKNQMQTYGIEFRNHEPQMNYRVSISNNHISGQETKYLIAVINDTEDKQSGTKGLGSGTIDISGNTATVGRIANAAMPIFVNEQAHDGAQRGAVTVANNDISVRERSDGSIEGMQFVGNAASYTVRNNRLRLNGEMNHAVISIHNRSQSEQPQVTIHDNDVYTAHKALSKRWIERVNTTVSATNNRHNDAAVDNEVSHTVAETEQAANEPQDTTRAERPTPIRKPIDPQQGVPGKTPKPQEAAVAPITPAATETETSMLASPTASEVTPVPPLDAHAAEQAAHQTLSQVVTPEKISAQDVRVWDVVTAVASATISNVATTVQTIEASTAVNHSQGQGGQLPSQSSANDVIVIGAAQAQLPQTGWHNQPLYWIVGIASAVLGGTLLWLHYSTTHRFETIDEYDE